jgi:hypothetical protein
MMPGNFRCGVWVPDHHSLTLACPGRRGGTGRDESALFREKCPVIESMARDGIKAGTVEDGVITLVMP